jgi:hypothetical protein
LAAPQHGKNGASHLLKVFCCFYNRNYDWLKPLPGKGFGHLFNSFGLLV